MFGFITFNGLSLLNKSLNQHATTRLVQKQTVNFINLLFFCKPGASLSKNQKLCGKGKQPTGISLWRAGKF